MSTRASAEQRQRALQDAFEYRGDVAILGTDESVIVGYVFDRRPSGPVEVPIEAIRLYVDGSDEDVTISVDQIAGVKFSGRDFATGAVWEARMETLNRKLSDAAKAAETANAADAGDSARDGNASADAR